jgi:multisubunit Na+/H+ antiporter MnhC subunit
MGEIMRKLLLILLVLFGVFLAIGCTGQQGGNVTGGPGTPVQAVTEVTVVTGAQAVTPVQQVVVETAVIEETPVTAVTPAVGLTEAGIRSTTITGNNTSATRTVVAGNNTTVTRTSVQRVTPGT